MDGYVLEVIHPLDNVVVAVEDIEAGTEVTVVHADTEQSLQVVDDIPFGHAIAVRSIGQGQPVIRGGARLGIASVPIQPGQHAHTHNMTVQ